MVTIMNTCPHCGNDEGYYDLEVCRIIQFYEWSGEPFKSQTSSISGGVRKYCIGCGRAVHPDKR